MSTKVHPTTIAQAASPGHDDAAIAEARSNVALHEKFLEVEMAAASNFTESKSSAGHRRSASGSIHVRNGSQDAFGPSVRSHRKSASMDSANSSFGAPSLDSTMSPQGDSGTATPKFTAPADMRSSRQNFVRTMTSVFEDMVNKMHSSHSIDPASRFWQWWSLLIMLLLLYTIVVLPLEVPFNDVVGNLFWADLAVDLVFITDIVLLFFVGYYDNAQGRVIMDLKTIGKAYLKSWFFVDLIAALPFMEAYALTSYTVDALAVLRLLKFVRFARLPRMFKTLQKNDPVNALEDCLSLTYAVKALLGHLCRLVVLCHWLACVWCLAAEAQHQAWERQSWQTEYGVQNEAWSTVYLSALYWAVMTFTTIGYGDVVPANNVERGVSIVSMILAATYYAYLVGAISTIINTSNQASHDFQTLMDNLNRWLHEYNCDGPLRRRLRHFFNLSQPLLKDKYYDDVLAKMSPGLRGEFCASLYRESLARVEFLQPPKSISADRKTQFLGILAQKLQPRAFPAGEQLIREGDGTSDANSLMYIVRRGLLGAKGRVIRSGGVIGEDIICRSSRRWYRVMCLTFVDALTLSHSDLFSTLESSSDLSEQLLKVRRAANKHALITTILEIVRRVRVLKVFLASAEAAAMGLGSPTQSGYKQITVRLDSDQYFDKNGEIFDPMKKVQELVQQRQERAAALKDSVAGAGAVALGGTPTSSPATMTRRRATAELEHKGEAGEHAVLHLSDNVNKQESIYDVLSRLDAINVENMGAVEALSFLDKWQKELLRIDATFASAPADAVSDADQLTVARTRVDSI